MPEQDVIFGKYGFTWRGRFYPLIAGGDGTDPQDPADPPADPKPEGDPPAPDVSGLKSALEKERETNKANAKLLKELQKFKEDADAASKSDAEKLTDRASKAEERAQQLAAELRAERTSNRVAQAAAKAQIPAEVAQRLITVEYDDEGNITTDLDKAAKEIATKYPGLVTGGASSGNPTNPARTRAQGAGDLSSALAAHYNQ